MKKRIMYVSYGTHGVDITDGGAKRGKDVLFTFGFHFYEGQLVPDPDAFAEEMDKLEDEGKDGLWGALMPRLKRYVKLHGITHVHDEERAFDYDDDKRRNMETDPFTVEEWLDV